MSEQSTPEEIEEIEEVDDPEELIQTRRIRDIFEARKEVRRERLRAKELKVVNSNHHTEPEQLYRAAVENYLTELRPLFLFDELGKQYWYNYDFGSIIVEPPTYTESVDIGVGSEADYVDIDGDSYVVVSKPEQKEIELDGLCYLFNTSDPVSVTWNLTAKEPKTEFGTGGGRRTVTKESYVYINFNRLDAAVNTANSYLAERGIELKPEEGLPEDELNL